MIFLIEYNREHGRIVTMRSFETSSRSEAEAARLELELDLNKRKLDHEVVLLEAASEDALRLTHRRYFEDLKAIAESSRRGRA